jgi:nucleoid-associated protein YgaU
MDVPALGPAMSRAALRRAAPALVLGVGGAAAAAVWLWPAHHAPDAPVSRVASHAAPAAPAPAPSSPAPHATRAPSFDVVRVTPQGEAVIAGRAAPGAQVTVHDGPNELGHATANSNGEWVIIPDRKLPPGGRELTLTEIGPDGVERKGEGSVLLAVPDVPSSPMPSVAVLAPPAGSPRVLQLPPAGKGAAGLGLDTVDYDQQGDIRFAGRAPPNTTVRIYIDNKPVGDATAGADGGWTLTPSGPVAGGRHQVRVDQLTPAGRVASRVELPFQRAFLPTALGKGQVVVQPGENLWRIARSVYGQGVRYVVIYRANRDQIRDPKLIYPGQAFAVPAPPLSTPASSRKSR